MNVADGLAHNGVYQSPCSDHCQQLRQQEEELVAMRLRGLARRREYLVAGFDNGLNEEVRVFSAMQFHDCSVYACLSYLTQLHVV